MVALRSLGTLAVLIALTGCGGDDSAPQLIDGSRAADLPAELESLEDAVLTRTDVVTPGDVDEFDACGSRPPASSTAVVERVGLHGSSITFSGGADSLYGCDKIADPLTAEDPDLPYGGIWCGSANGHVVNGALKDPRLSLCPNIANEITAFAWVDPQSDSEWVVVSDAGRREVYEVAESLPVRVTTTDVQRGSSTASFDIEEYGADGRRVRRYTLEASVAG